MNGAAIQPVGRRRWTSEPRVLFVEGYSDLLFYAELMEHLGRMPCFIQDLGGKGREKLKDQAELLLRPDNLAAMESVGVILDADNNAQAAFEQARSALRQVVRVEIERPNTWVCAPGGRTKFGVFIVGDPSGKGEIETLAWLAWKEQPPNQALSECVDSYLKCAQRSGQSLQSPDKVRIGTLLSVLNEEDPRLGPGARAKAFDFEAERLLPLRQFLGQM